VDGGLVAHGELVEVSGVVLGLGTPYGLVRYWWVAIKLAINIAFVALVLVALRPEVLEVAEQGRQFAAGLPASLAVGDLIYPPIVSPILAVFKPSGLIRKRSESMSAAR
jgi:hypothetical protein